MGKAAVGVGQHHERGPGERTEVSVTEDDCLLPVMGGFSGVRQGAPGQRRAQSVAKEVRLCSPGG